MNRSTGPYTRVRQMLGLMEVKQHQQPVHRTHYLDLHRHRDSSRQELKEQCSTQRRGNKQRREHRRRNPKEPY